MAAVVQYAYDKQIRRFVTQFIRMLSNFQVEFGNDANGIRALQTVPVYYGDVSRQAAMILKNNSENTLSAVPAMATYISGLSYDRDRLQNPYYEGVISVRERVFNETTQSYQNTQDGVLTVERLMPAPYKLSMKVDIWTSNTEQKHQLIEQIAPLFNPGLEIQSTDNYIDWTSLSVVLLTDVAYTNRSVPMSSDDTTIDIATLTFEMPIWLSLPAKVKRGGVITQIIASIYDESGTVDINNYNLGPATRQKFTILNSAVYYTGNTLTLYADNVNDADGTVYGTKQRWADLLQGYGKLTNGVSQVRLTFPYTDGTHEIVGTVAFNPVDPTQLLITPFANTLPANTVSPVDAIIDPFTVTVNSSILSPGVGTRYLILNPIGDANSESAAAWAGSPGTNLIANAHDIIEWNGNYWTVVFDSQREPNIQYVSNLTTTVQYQWTGSNWVKSYEGLYAAGDWSLVL